MSHEDTRTRRGIALPPFPFALSLSKGRPFFRVAKKDGASTSSARPEESRSFVSLRLRANPIGYTTPSSAFFSPAFNQSAPATSRHTPTRSPPTPAPFSTPPPTSPAPPPPAPPPP